MADQRFENEIGQMFLQPPASSDAARLVAPLMRRIAAEDRQRAYALGGAAIAGAALAVGAVIGAGAPAAMGDLVSGVADSFALVPQFGLWTLLPLGVAALAATAFGLTRAAQEL